MIQVTNILVNWLKIINANLFWKSWETSPLPPPSLPPPPKGWTKGVLGSVSSKMAIVGLRLEDGWLESEKCYKRLKKTPNTELSSFSMAVQCSKQSTALFHGLYSASKRDKNAKTPMQKTICLLQRLKINNNFTVHPKIKLNSTVQ